MVRVFISQPMRGVPEAEIRRVRDDAFARVADMYAENGEDCREVPSWFDSKGAAQFEPLELLGKSLELMSRADVAVFCKGWESARGCRIEHLCAREYGIEIVELL